MSYLSKRVVWDWDYLQSLPDDTDCYQLTRQEVNFLLAMHPHYTWSTRWDNVGDSTQDDRSAFGANILDKLLTPSPDCGGDSGLGECYRLPATHPSFKFEPNDPFDGNDENFTAVGSRWRTFNDVIEDGIVPNWLETTIEFFGESIGYFPNDVFVTYPDITTIEDSILNFGINSFFQNFNLFPFPVIKWKARGKGQFEIEFCSVPAGGRFVVTWDITLDYQQILDILDGSFQDEIDNFAFVDVNRDLLSIPPELVSTAIFEIDFDEDTEHAIQAFFVPTFDDSLPVVFPFGGIREIEVCGLDIFNWETGEYTDSIRYNEAVNKRSSVIGVTKVSDICDCVEDGILRVFARALSGSPDNLTSGVTINTDGTISVSNSSDSSIPQTVSFQRDRMARMERLENSIENYLSDWEEAYNQYGNSEIAMAEFMEVQYSIINDDADSMALQYQTFRNAPNPAINTSLNGLDRIMYCQGYDKRIINGFILDDGIDEPLLRVGLIGILDDEQFDFWYNQANESISDDFKNASCYRVPNEIVTYNAQVATNTQAESTNKPAFGAGTFKLSLSPNGILSTDLYTYDGFYRTLKSTGVKTYDPLILVVYEGNNVGNKKTDGAQSQPSFDDNQNYQVIYIMGGGPNNWGIWGIQISSTVFNDDNLSGTMAVTITDRR